MIDRVYIRCRACNAFLGGRRLDAQFCCARCRKTWQRFRVLLAELDVQQQRIDLARAEGRKLLADLNRQSADADG